MTYRRPSTALGLAFAGLLAARCASSQNPPPSTGPDGGAGATGTGGGAGGSAGGGSGGGSAGSGGGSGGGGGGSQGTPDAGNFGDAATVVPGAPGCGLGTPAFCETFDKPVGNGGRAGELDHRLWSGARVLPQLPTSNGLAIGIADATLPACRNGLPAKVGPDRDTLVCDPTPELRNNHLLVAVAGQNYGQNAYRIRQPFDFAGRTGKIVFDAEGFIYNFLLGWVSIEISEDPVNGPGYSIGGAGTTNDEGTIVPRNAVEVQLAENCGGTGTMVGLRFVDVITNYQDNVVMPKPQVCVSTKRGALNHFEVSISQQKIEVYGTDASADGSTFGPLKLLFSSTVNVPFTRGYVSISTHNHASLKYGGSGNIPKLDAWTARWDNVGFDGPVVGGWREYEIEDSLTAGKDGVNLPPGPVKNVGYVVPDAAGAPKALTFKGVDIANVATARLSLSSWYLPGGKAADYVLRLRWNGKAWTDRKLTAGELAVFTNGHCQGALSQIIDVPVSDLVAGDNVLEVASSNVDRGYPPAISNIDLVLGTR